MSQSYSPPGFLDDFDQAVNPAAMYKAWDRWMGDNLCAEHDFPAWYAPFHPPGPGVPKEAAPPWQGLPRTALVLNDNNVIAAAKSIDAAVAFGSGPDGLLDEQKPFLDGAGHVYPGVFYRPQDEYLEWVTQGDPDGVAREVWLTCEGPEYWQRIAKDHELLVKLYASLLNVAESSIDRRKLFFQTDVSQKNAYSAGGPITYKKDNYNPYNQYNAEAAIHLTQVSNTLGAEITLAKQASRLYGNPPKTSAQELICCADCGSVNRASDPTIGMVVNDLVRDGYYVTLRDPVGLYMHGIRDNDFTDWNDRHVDVSDGYFVPTRKSPDGRLILRARFAVPDGVKRNGKQARVGDLKYRGVPIRYGAQVADAVTMHLFAQALPGAPRQTPVPCKGHPCPDTNHPDHMIFTRIGFPCQ